MKEQEKLELIQKVGRVRSGCLVASWALETMKMELNPPESDELKFELQEGLEFLLDSLAGELKKVQGLLLKEKTPAQFEVREPRPVLYFPTEPSYYP